jgi:hypothetical protein
MAAKSRGEATAAKGSVAESVPGPAARRGTCALTTTLLPAAAM